MPTKQKEKNIKLVKKTNDEPALLIVFNDDFNTFDHVINCFVKICKLTTDEAISKTFFIHYNGQDIVQKGDFEIMKKMRKALTEEGLTAVVQYAEQN